MKKINKKQSGFTLVELMISIVIFSLIVVGLSSAMTTIFANTRKELSFTKDMYNGQSSIETGSAMINDLELKVGDKMTDEQFKKISKTLRKVKLEETINDNDKDKDDRDTDKDKLKKKKDNCISYVQKFKAFESSRYKTDVDGYMLSERAQGIRPGEMIFFLTNDNKEALNVPVIENVRIDNTSISDEKNGEKAFRIDFFYYNTDYLKTHPIRKMYFDGQFSEVEGKFNYKKGTDNTVFGEEHKWYYSNQMPQASDDYEPRAFEPILLSQNNNKIPENAGGLLPSNEDYNETKHTFKEYPKSEIHKIFKNDDEAYDFYLKYRVTPKTKTHIKIKPTYSNPVWVIGLPYTKNLYYHFDVALEGRFLAEADETASVTYLKDLPTFINILDTTEKKAFKLVKKSGNSQKNFEVYKHEKYGKYIKLSGKKDEFKYLRKGEKSGKGSLVMFLVVDTKKVKKDGTIIRRTDKSFELGYKNKKFTLKVGDQKPIEVKQNATSSTHIVTVVINGSKGAGLAVDGMEFKKIKGGKAIDRSKPLTIGGANGMKIKEIIGYDASGKIGSNGKMSKKSMKKVYDYLYRKHFSEYITQ